MGVMRQRSSDRLGSLIQEMENADDITEEMGDAHGHSPTLLKGCVSAPNLTASPTVATKTIPLAAVNNKLAKNYFSVFVVSIAGIIGVAGHAAHQAINHQWPC